MMNRIAFGLILSAALVPAFAQEAAPAAVAPALVPATAQASAPAATASAVVPAAAQAAAPAAVPVDKKRFIDTPGGTIALIAAGVAGVIAVDAVANDDYDKPSSP